RTAGGQRPAVGAERHVGERGGPSERVNPPTCLQFAQLHGLIVVPRRGQVLAVRAEGHGPHGASVPAQWILRLTRGHVPELDDATLSSGGHRLAIGAEREE